MVELTHNPIDVSDVTNRVTSPRAGAVVVFLGTTREFTGERHTTALDYEAYDQMAVRKLEELEQQAQERWPIVECCVIHRLGRVPPAEASVAVAVSTPHRQDAFEAGKWLIDSLKQCVPIWKREQWADGSQEWVHSGLDGKIEA